MVAGCRRDQNQQAKLGGIGSVIAQEIERRTHRETRTAVLGHLQRGGSPTTFDRVLATQFGAHAVRLVHQGRLGEMICYQPPKIASVPIIEAVNELSSRSRPHLWKPSASDAISSGLPTVSVKRGHGVA